MVANHPKQPKHCWIFLRSFFNSLFVSSYIFPHDLRTHLLYMYEHKILFSAFLLTTTCWPHQSGATSGVASTWILAWEAALFLGQQLNLSRCLICFFCSVEKVGYEINEIKRLVVRNLGVAKNPDYQWKPPKTQTKLANALIILVIKWLGDFSVRRYHGWPVDRIGDDSVSPVPVWRYGTLNQGKRACLGFEKECHGFCWRVKLNLVSSCFNLEKPLRNSRIPESLDCWMPFEEFVERHQKILGSPPRCVAVPKEQFFTPCFSLLRWNDRVETRPFLDGGNVYNRFDSMTI